MKAIIKRILMAAFLALLQGCAGPTPIKQLALPPVSIIEGRITQLDVGGFTLQDDSGTIYVRAQLPGNAKLPLAIQDRVRVYGNLMGGPDRNFDGYVIRKPTGEKIMVSRPSPHLGFVLQTSFD
jgi:hypothetical protein